MISTDVFVGIDYHKRYSVILAVDGAGRRFLEGRVTGNAPEGFQTIFGRSPSGAKVAGESSP